MPGYRDMRVLARLFLFSSVMFLAPLPVAAQGAAQEHAKEQAQRQQEQPLNNAPVWRDVRSSAAYRSAMVATLMVSQGVPMLLSGDEIGNGQQGNNNVYCQDNDLGWLDWEGKDDQFLDFCARMITLRRQYPVLCQENFLMGETGDNERVEIAWFQPDGIHPNARAQPRLLENVWPALSVLLAR